MRLIQFTHLQAAGLVLLLATSTSAQNIRSGLRSRDGRAPGTKLGMGRREEMRPGAGEAEQSAAGATPSGTGTGAGGEGEGDEEGSEASAQGSGDQSGDTGSNGAAGGETGGGGSGGSNTLYLVSHEDFCVYGPREANKAIASTGQDVVSWCTTGDHGTQVIPEGTFQGITYVKTPNYVQVSGYGDFTKLNIASTDAGGQLDSSEHTPEGAQMILGGGQTAASWVTVIGADTFCVRACTGDPQYCPTQYDELGCWFLTSNGVGWPDAFQDCEGDGSDIPGVIDGQTYTPGEGPVPTPSSPAVSNCQAGPAVHGAAVGASATTPPGSDHASVSGSASGPIGGSLTGSSGASGTGSASLVPVETCIPCAQAPLSAGAAGVAAVGGGGGTSAVVGGTSPAAPSGTIDVGMGPISTGNAAAGVTSSGASGAATGSATTSEGIFGGMFDKRQSEGDEASAGGEGGEGAGSDASGEESEAGGGSVAGSSGTSAPAGGATSSGSPSLSGALSGVDGGATVTKGDQCCFTTHIPAGGGVASPTSTSAGAAGLPGGQSGAGTASHPYNAMSGSHNASITGGVGTNGTKNGTGNGTDLDSGAWKVDGMGSVTGMGSVVLCLVLGVAGGWWTLI